MEATMNEEFTLPAGYCHLSVVDFVRDTYIIPQHIPIIATKVAPC